MTSFKLVFLLGTYIYFEQYKIFQTVRCVVFIYFLLFE